MFAAPKVNKIMPYSKGLNLSTWLEPFGAGNSCSTHFDRTDFENIKSLGVEVLRIPIHFEQWSKGAPDYVVEDWLWECVDNAVSWCEELKMYVIIDFHNDCNGNSKTRPDVEKMLLKIWPQIAKRYKDKSQYVIYEVMNEPHMKSGNLSADISKWAKIQGNVLKTIRSIDTKHTVIVGAENWNALDAMLMLPDYKDDNLIYNFHDYSPFLFTHQGASWTDVSRLKNIPFPYVKEKMPPLPKDATEAERRYYREYEKASAEEVLVEPLNKAVAFANERKVALMCNEYGVLMDHADNEERTNWYRMKAKWMEERGIIRVSWDYQGGFGIFNKPSGNFPEDANTVLLKGMGFNPPLKNNVPAKKGWIDEASKTGNYSLYKNGFAKGIKVEGWIHVPVDKVVLGKKTEGEKDSYISISQAVPYDTLVLNMKKPTDLTSLKDKNLVFEMRTNQKDLRLNVYFRNPEENTKNKADLPWRCGMSLRKENFKNDGQWHTVSIPLSKLEDIGAWSNYQNKWYPSEKIFDWKKVEGLVFDFVEVPVTAEISIKNIEIK